jgi:hypothetical protein
MAMARAIEMATATVSTIAKAIGTAKQMNGAMQGSWFPFLSLCQPASLFLSENCHPHHQETWSSHMEVRQPISKMMTMRVRTGVHQCIHLNDTSAPHSIPLIIEDWICITIW